MNGLVVWWDPPASGPDNMAADELLAAEAVRRNQPLVRLYAWTEPTVSLGGFQRLADAHRCPAIAGLPLVRRPSGGGGILHGSDLTYAAAVPRDHPWGGDPQVLYDAFHAALAAWLRARGIAARQHPGRGRDSGDEDRFLCFDRRARGDLVIDVPSHPDGHKILGSAQRRLHAAVLQHGSLLERSPSFPDAEARHPGLHELLPAGSIGAMPDLVRGWLEGVARQLDGVIAWRHEPFTNGRDEDLQPLASRFRSEQWLARR